MHPILGSGGRLGPYLVAWIPVAALVAGLLVLSGAAGWLEAAVLAVPLALVHAFLCLSSWYLCRAVPVRSVPFPRLAGTLVVTAACAGALWAAAAATLSSFLGFWDRMAPVADRLGGALVPLVSLGALLYLLGAALHYLLVPVDETRTHERQALAAQALAQEAELKSLRAQLAPHFLFNALHAVSALTTSDPAGARETCLKLSGFLRRSLGFGAKERVPLSEELALVRDYLAIEKVRFGERLRLEELVDPGTLGCSVPPLLLQPLVENAIAHGIEGLVDGGSVRLEAHAMGDTVRISVENAFDPDAKKRMGAGKGLSLVRDRLAATFGAAATMTTTDLGGRFRVELSVPAAGIS
jgi:hypothetical protein